ncbi:MAG: cytochrome c [Bacteroidetes bacterium]|nr:cytochrome c [Bacteroidota bacterium]
MKTKKLNLPTLINPLGRWIFILAMGGMFLISCAGNDADTKEKKDDGLTVAPTNEAPKTETATVNVDELAKTDKGIGPVAEEIKLGAIEDAVALDGKKIFDAKCTACHNADDKKKVGPGLHGVTKRRLPEWIMNMILNPSEMLQKDPVAKEVAMQHMGAVMANQNLTKEDARKVVEYFRQNDSK